MSASSLPVEAILSVSLDAAIVMRADGTIAGWNEQAERTFGWSRAEALGRPLCALIIPERYRAAHRAGLRRYLATGEGPVLDRRIEITALHRRGDELPVELSITALPTSGEPLFLGYLRDISERKRAELALRESEARLGATYHHALVGIAETDRAGIYVRANEEFMRLTGYTADELTRLTIFDLTHPGDAPIDRELYVKQWSGEIDTYSLEKRYIQKDGSIIWVELAASIVRGGNDSPSYGVRIVRDISERRRAEAYQRLLLNELNHRVKNTLAVVQGIAQQSFREGTPLPDARAAFEGRLAALSAAHNVLTRQNWEAASLREIVEGAVAPHASRHQPFVIEGPDLRLPPKTALSLALALHELGTNAAKYGALSVPEGKVEIRWRVEDDRLRLVWREHGGPEVAPPTRRGFGTRMIERGLAAELGGSVKIDFDRQGVVCIIDAPVPDALASI